MSPLTAPVPQELRPVKSLHPQQPIPRPHSVPRRILHAVPERSQHQRRPTQIDGTVESVDSPPDPAPPPHRFIQTLAVHAYEVLDGARAVAQLGPWITQSVAAELIARRAARTERRTLYRDQRRVVPVAGRVHLHQPTPHTIEATVVLRTKVRAAAVAIRLEYSRARWRATHLTVL